MKKILPLLLAACLLAGCSASRKRPYQYVDYTLFDTVTTVLGYGVSQAAFEEQAKALCENLREYHRLFDIYKEYAGMVNLKTVNDRAGTEPVAVDSRILALLQDCKDYYQLTGGRVNVAMGSVLSLWHDARTQALDHPEAAALPNREALEAAATHSSMENLILDPEKGTVFLADPQMRLDVGAVAKGWSVERVCREAPAGMLVSVGGNVCATGPKPGDQPWVVGVQSPDGAGYLLTVDLFQGSAVTSGDYQRFFTVAGKNYHHIIDPDTLEPGGDWRSVTILCEDSGLGDCLSTALFLLPQDAGQALLEATGAEAMWLDRDGNTFYSPGFETRIHENS